MVKPEWLAAANAKGSGEVLKRVADEKGITVFRRSTKSKRKRRHMFSQPAWAAAESEAVGVVGSGAIGLGWHPAEDSA